MNNVEFQLRVGDPRLAVHATRARPAWLWSIDGTRILWANPVGARLFGAANAAALAAKTFGPADSHRRQVALLARRLPANGAIRLQRLRGFGAAPGTLVTCSCARLDFADGSHGLLVAAAESVGRAMPLVERLQRLVDGIEAPIAAFARDGIFIGASDAARSLPGFRDLFEAGLVEGGLGEGGLGDARHYALTQGRAELDVGIGRVVLQRVGSGADIGLVALMENGAAAAAPSRPVAPASTVATDDEAPANSGEAPATIVPVGEFAELPEQIEAAPHQPAPPPVPDDATHATPDQAAAQISAEVAAEVAAGVAIDAPEEPPAEPAAAPEPTTDVHPHEPSPYTEAVADEPELAPSLPPAEEPALVTEQTAPTSAAPPPVAAPSWLDEPAPATRRHPLRFMWQMDPESRFSLGSDEFTRLIGARTAAGFGRLWSDIAEVFGLDPDGSVLKAVATRDTWSGIVLNWPVDGGGRLPVELSGLPIYDRARNFAGYRGFGVCRDLDGLARLAALRRYELFSDPPATRAPSADSADIIAADVAREARTPDTGAASSSTPDTPELSAPLALETSPPTDLEIFLETSVETPKNVVPFRQVNEGKSPALTPVENSAFNELARQLAERLAHESGTPAAPPPPETFDATVDLGVEEPPAAVAEIPEAGEQPSWLARPEPPARGESRRDRTLLDLLPVGVLIYRLDRLLYANPAFLARMGYDSLHALEDAGGLDALYVEPGVSSASSTSGTGTPVTISATQPSLDHTPPSTTEAHLFTIAWDDDSALALIFSGALTPAAQVEVEVAAEIAEPVAVDEPSAVGHANAEELGAILDTTAEGILMFDAEGNINSCNRSAEALFGYDGAELVQRNLAELFAPESAPAVLDYLASVKGADIASLLDHGRDALAAVCGGGLIPVSLTMGRTQAHGPNFFAVFRDLSQSRKNESELHEARRLADRAATAKADMLARISHDVRTPLNAIIGFAEVMIGARFGALGNERYVEYMKDIRASGERVIAIINDLLDLSRIETGKLDLAFANQNLNDLVEQCVAVMQPQANRERIIIRTSLAHMLPPVLADARALRQITLNLIGNSIHLANAGGQVIVSTALSDFGDVVLRVRDTGHGLNDNEVAAAMEPFRSPAPTDQASDSSGVNLSLIKALVEANRARFQIKTGPHSGTLIEVVFSQAKMRA
jgi:PAS domain S-box-containing protein